MRGDDKYKPVSRGRRGNLGPVGRERDQRARRPETWSDPAPQPGMSQIFDREPGRSPTRSMSSRREMRDYGKSGQTLQDAMDGGTRYQGIGDYFAGKKADGDRLSRGDKFKQRQYRKSGQALMDVMDGGTGGSKLREMMNRDSRTTPDSRSMPDNVERVERKSFGSLAGPKQTSERNSRIGTRRDEDEE